MLIERVYPKFLGKGKFSRKASVDSGVESSWDSEDDEECSKTDSMANEVEVDAQFKAELQADEVEVLEGSNFSEICYGSHFGDDNKRPDYSNGFTSLSRQTLC